MPDQVPKPKPQPKEEFDSGHVPMTEEFDSAKWRLPPVVPVLIALGIVAIAVAVFTFGTRYKPVIAGEVQQVYAMDVPDQNTVLLAVQVAVRTTGTEKPVFIHGASADLTTADGQQLHDTAAPMVDIARYFQAFPDLQQHSTAILQPETKIPAGGQQQGTVIFGFPVAKQAFDQRKALEVTIEIYDQKPLKLTVK